jgi:hypothetical protein
MKNSQDNKVREDLTPKFPPELLKASNKERRQYFYEKKLSHPILAAKQKEILEKIQLASSKDRIIYVFGPTRVGKSSLFKGLTIKLGETVHENPSYTPVASVEIAPPLLKKDYEWTDFFIRALKEMREPSIENKIIYPDQKAPYDTILKNERGASRFLRSYENCLKYRKVNTMLIDEAQHFAKVRKPEDLETQTEILKSFVNLTNTIHILFGSYDLMKLRDLNEQLISRSIDVHFHRYRNQNPVEWRQYQQTVDQFLMRMPLEVMPDPEEFYNLLYMKTLGCIGSLKMWLDDALQISLEDGHKCLSKKTLEKTAPKAYKVEKMLEVIMKNEATYFDEQDAKYEELLSMKLNIDRDSDEENIAAEDAAGKRDNKKNQKVGVRGTARDPVGISEEFINSEVS